MLQYKNHMDKSLNKEIARLFQTFTYEGYKWPKTLLKGVKQPPATVWNNQQKKQIPCVVEKVNQSHLR